MPIYEYQCEVCGHRFELLQKVNDAPATDCTECGGQVERLLSTPAIQFKGTGWYVTDYARKESGSSRDAGKKDSSSTETSSDSSRKTSGPAASASSTSKD